MKTQTDQTKQEKPTIGSTLATAVTFIVGLAGLIPSLLLLFVLLAVSFYGLRFIIQLAGILAK